MDHVDIEQLPNHSTVWPCYISQFTAAPCPFLLCFLRGWCCVFLPRRSIYVGSMSCLQGMSFLPYMATCMTFYWTLYYHYFVLSQFTIEPFMLDLVTTNHSFFNILDFIHSTVSWKNKSFFLCSRVWV